MRDMFLCYINSLCDICYAERDMMRLKDFCAAPSTEVFVGIMLPVALDWSPNQGVLPNVCGFRSPLRKAKVRKGL